MKCKHVLIPVAVVIAIIIGWWFYPASEPSNTLQVEKQQPTVLPIQDKQLTKPKISAENIQHETKPLKADTVNSAISDIDKSDIEGLFQDILDESTPKVGNRDYVYPQYSKHVVADGGKAKKFVGKVLENFRGIEEIKFSVDVWNTENTDTSDPFIQDAVITIRGNDMVFEVDGSPAFKYIDGMRMLYRDGQIYHIDETEEGAPGKIQALLERFPWDSSRMVSIRQENNKGDIVEKDYIEVTCALNDAKALINPETMELWKLEYVQEAKEGNIRQLLPIKTEYLNYVDIAVTPARTVRYPSRIKCIFNNTRREQGILKDIKVKMKKNFEEQ